MCMSDLRAIALSALPDSGGGAAHITVVSRRLGRKIEVRGYIDFVLRFSIQSQDQAGHHLQKFKIADPRCAYAIA